MFSQNWEVRLVFAKGCHHGWQIFFWCNSFWERNISEHDIMQYTQITTDKCFCSQVTVKQSTVFFYEW